MQELNCLVNQPKAEKYLYSAIAAIDTEINKASIFIFEDPESPLYALPHMLLGQQLLAKWFANRMSDNQMQEVNVIQQLKEAISHLSSNHS